MRPTEKMPTMGRLVAAVLLGGLAYYGAGIVIAIWPEDFNFGWFQEFTALVGLVTGWRVIGKRLGNGVVPGINAGLTGLAVMLFWLFLLLAFNEMIGRSLDLRYDGPFEAINNMFAIAYEWALNLQNVRLWILMVVGAMVTGMVSELVSKKAS
ncbi:MAG: TrgA family protein [Pseudomonadota bacterium]